MALGVGHGVSSATARATHLRTVAARHRRRTLTPAPMHATEADPSRRGDVGGVFKYGSGASQSRRTGGDWASKEGAGDGAGGDYLRELGASQNYNINIDHGQSWANIDYLFAGERLGHKADIADGSLRSYETRSFAHLVGDYYVAPRFLEAVAMHITKNVLMDQGGIDGRVPLILGIWGGKGQGKSFQTELAFRKLGVVPIVMSAGELEHEWAGTPGRLIRERYRKASEVIRNQGRLSCLMINDLDAGIGRFGDTQVTVNNQMVVGTLMNICDDPKRVSLGEEWREAAELHRVPIIVTGNDFSRLYAPLVRDGRMEKFYWRPSKDDLLGILHAMYRDDGLSMDDVSTLLTSFPGQPLDFFGAIRAAVYDDHIKDWLSEVMEGSDPDCWEPRHLKELSRRLIHKEYLPDVDSVRVTLRMLLLQGRRLVAEQEHVMGNKLSEEYMKDLKREKEAAKRVTGSAVPSDRRPSASPPPPESDVTKALFEKARAQLMKAGFIAPPEPVQQLDTSDQDVDSPWPRVDPVEAKHLMDTEGYVFVDVRPVKEFERESFLHALNIPVVKVNGFGSSATVEPLQTCFLEAVRERFPDFRNSKLLIVGDDDGEYAAHAIESLLDEGCTHAAEVCGGFSAWAKKFRPNGERRAEGGGWVSADGREELFGTGG